LKRPSNISVNYALINRKTPLKKSSKLRPELQNNVRPVFLHPKLHV
jgi:hypothetical protein